MKSDEVVELPLDALIVSFGFSTNNKTFVTGMLITNALALLLMRSLKPHKKVFMRSVMQQNMKVRLT